MFYRNEGFYKRKKHSYEKQPVTMLGDLNVKFTGIPMNCVTSQTSPKNPSFSST